MFRRLTALSAVGVIAFVTGPAHAGGSHRQQPVRAAGLRLTPAMLAESLVAAGASRRMVDAALRGAHPLGDPQESGSASVTATAELTTSAAVSSVGDFTGDGVREVADTRYRFASDTTKLALFVRDGASGAVLWSRHVKTNAEHLVLPIAFRLGAHARPGIELVDIGFTQSQGSEIVSLGLKAIGDKGKLLWTQHLSGTVDDGSGDMHHVPFPIGDGTFESATEDLLITRTDASNGDSTGTVTPVRVSGVDGSVVTVGDAVTSSSGLPDLTTAPDLSGDGLTDVVLTVPGDDDDSGVQARRGDGSAIWSNTTLTLNPGAAAMPVGDVHPSADGSPVVTDLAVRTGVPNGGVTLPLPIPNPVAPGEHGEVALLDGSTGSTVWSKSGDSAYPVLKAGPALVPATGVVSADATSDGSKSTTTMTLTTYDDSGTQVYSAKYTVSAPGSDAVAGGGVAVPIGDFEPDGSADGLAIVTVVSGGSFNERDVLFHGVDGSKVAAGKSFPLGVSTDGKGDDLVRVHTHGGITVTVTDGKDRSLLFRRAARDSAHMPRAYALGAVLRPRSACADVVLVGEGKHHGLGAVLASNGRPRWWVTYDPHARAAGTVHQSLHAPHPSCG